VLLLTLTGAGGFGTSRLALHAPATHHHAGIADDHLNFYKSRDNLANTVDHPREDPSNEMLSQCTSGVGSVPVWRPDKDPRSSPPSGRHQH
jgi:hypothetical protein